METSSRPEDPGTLQTLPKTEEEATPKVTFGPQTKCPKCGSPPTSHQVRNYDPRFHDGDVYCRLCGAFVRFWDADT